jgi:hypothetical protein
MNARGSALGMQRGLHRECKGVCIGNAKGSALGMQGGPHWACLAIVVGRVLGYVLSVFRMCLGCVLTCVQDMF